MQNLEKLKRWSNQKKSIGVKNLRMGKITKSIRWPMDTMTRKDLKSHLNNL